jgi:glycerol-3-phosphate cytidylyltransferase
MFHMGHLNLIRRAREQCDKLIIGLNSDNFIYSYKYKYPTIEEPPPLPTGLGH